MDWSSTELDFTVRIININKGGILAKEEGFVALGTVLEALPNAVFKVQLENGHKILAHISGKIRINLIKIIPGDTVQIEFSPYDLDKGRIIFREK